MSVNINNLEKIASKVITKIKKIQSDSYDSSLRGHPSELAEFKNVITVASKTLKRDKIYFENHIEKAGYSSFHLSDALEILRQILDTIEKRKRATKRRKNKKATSVKKSS